MLGALKFNSAKCETTCRLCLGRIKLLKNKRNMQMKQYRKDIAELLRAGKQDYARIRVEAVIREAFTLTAYEILELYLELLAVRSSLVANSKEIPRDMVEALSSVLYAASRVPDLPELLTLHKMFAAKYGKEYVTEACSDQNCSRWMVNENLRKCLTIEPPEPAHKLETLSEIAQEYGVEWDMDRARRDLLPDHDLIGMGSLGAVPPLQGHNTSSSAHSNVGSLVYTSGEAQQHPAQYAVPAPGSVVGQVPPYLPPAGCPPTAAPAHGAPAGGYADVAAAAAAAVAAAQQARNAAEAAARLAGAAPPGAPGNPARGGRGGGQDGAGGDGGGMVAAAAAAQGKPAPAHGWLSGMDDTFAAAAASSGPSSEATGPVQMHALPVASAAQQPWQQSTPAHGSVASDASAGPAGYRVPSAEEIQRAYDMAQGPPPKPNTAAATTAAGPASTGPVVLPPAAPPVRDDDTGTTAPATGSGDGTTGSSNDLAGLPGVPHTGVSASSAASSEYDELQKRFEALKKS